MKLLELSIILLSYTLWYKSCTKYESKKTVVESALWTLQTEIFVQERFASLSVYILYIRYFRPCSGRQSMASGSTVAGVHAGVVNGIAARRTLPRLLPSNISCAQLCGTRHRGLTSLAPVSALSRSRRRSHSSSNIDLCTAMLKLY